MARMPVRLFGLKIPFLAYDFSIADPAFAAILQMGAFGLGSYGTYEALKFAAFYRGVALISGTIATLPLRTYKNAPDDDGDTTRVVSSSFLDTNPAGPYALTPYTWKERVAFEVVSQGECGLLHVRNEAGGLVGLWPVSRSAYKVELQADGSRLFEVSQVNGPPKPLTEGDFTQILGLSLDGVHGISPVALFQRGIQLAAAQEVASMRQATGGFKVAGLVSPASEDVSEDDAKAIQNGVNANMSGPDKAGAMIFVNKRLTFTKWDQTNDEAQFLELRRYAREEAALMLGLPQFMLEPSKQTSWGTGIEQQFLGLQKMTFAPITSRIEEAVSRAISPGTKFVEFDYQSLLQPDPETFVKIKLEELDAGILSEEEYREAMGYGPKDPNDTFRTPVPAKASGALPLEPAESPPAEMTAPSNGKMMQ